MTLFSQLSALFWKQKANLRADYPSLLAVILLPSALMFLASTNGGSINTSASLDLIECKIDNFLYCNYPIDYFPGEEFYQDWWNDTDSVRTNFDKAAASVAEILGSDYDTLFDTMSYTKTTKLAANLIIYNDTYASPSWYNGKNLAFVEHFATLFNQELNKVGSSVQLEETVVDFEWEAGSAFDLRIGSFLLLLQVIGGEITSETSSNLFFYFTRAGLLPSVYWGFQYLYWMIVASVSIGVTAIFGTLMDKEIDVDAYFVAAWFHISFGVLLASIFKSNKVVNMFCLFLMLFEFVIPIAFQFMKQTETNEKVYDALLCIPVFFTIGTVTERHMWVGCIITAVTMALAAYLAPLMAGKSDGMYAGSKVNPLYFLTSGFWKNGIIASPSHDTAAGEGDEEAFAAGGGGGGDDGSSGLVFSHCVKRFEGRTCLKRTGEDKIIGPLSIRLETGKITTLLGPNGVGKSTLMRVAAGYYIPSGGEMILNGTNIFRQSPYSCLQSISFCPQDNYLYENMTVEEHLIFMSSIRDMSRVDNVGAHVDWIFETLGILDKKATLARNLSGGMKRRLCLAIAVIGFPPVVLCDEPSSGVDSINQRGIWKLLETMKENSAILLTSHSPLEAVILSDSVVMMESSELITQNNGVEGMAFSIKDEVEHITTEYDVNGDNAEELANIISSIPNDGSEWKIASKRLTGNTLPPLEDILLRDPDDDEIAAGETELQAADGVPVAETLNCEAPSTWRQVRIILSIFLLHPDRAFFLIFFGIPLNAGQIWVASQYEGWGDLTRITITPLVPLIPFIACTIIVVQLTKIFATERALGITKLYLSQGISRFAYLFAYVLLYSIFSYPVSLVCLLVIGSIYGTNLGMFCLFVLYTSFQYFLVGFCCALGSLLDPRTAFIITIILPSCMAIFAQGSTASTFHNTYPGAVGQILTGLLIDDVDRTEWNLFAVSIFLNIAIGSVSFFIFMARLGNYNPLRNLCKKDEKRTYQELEDDVETSARERKILLEGRAIDKTYGIGEKDSASFKALDNVTFSIEEGSLLGLVGKSGAGKSTLMDILSGQISVSGGAVYVEGEQVFPAEISKVVSMCGQLDTIWPKIKVSSAIAIFMLCRGYKGNIHCAKEITDPHISHLVKELGIHEMLNKKVGTLSGGQKRRLAFLMSLMGNIKVVLVDEAMTGVDIESRQIMWKILQDEVRLRGRSVVVTSHNMGEVEQYCNTVGILHQGKLVEMGPLDEIKKKWGDSIKLICLFSSLSSVVEVGNIIAEKQPDIVVESPEIDILNDTKKDRILVTYAINLIDLRNVTGLIHSMTEYVNDPSMLYWSIEPQSLDDFVRSKSKPESIHA